MKIRYHFCIYYSGMPNLINCFYLFFCNQSYSFLNFNSTNHNFNLNELSQNYC